MIYRVRDSVYVLGYQALLGIEYTVINRAMMPIWRAPSSGSILMPAAHAGPRAGRARPRLALGLAVSGLALALSALASRLPAGARRGLGPRTSVWPCRFPAPPALRGRGINTGRKQYRNNISYMSPGVGPRVVGSKRPQHVQSSITRDEGSRRRRALGV